MFPDVYQDLEDGRYFVKANVAGVSYRRRVVSGGVETHASLVVPSVPDCVSRTSAA